MKPFKLITIPSDEALQFTKWLPSHVMKSNKVITTLRAKKIPAWIQEANNFSLFFDFPLSQNEGQGYFIVVAIHEWRLMCGWSKKFLSPLEFSDVKQSTQPGKASKPWENGLETKCSIDIQPSGMDTKQPLQWQVNSLLVKIFNWLPIKPECGTKPFSSGKPHANQDSCTADSKNG